MGIDIKTIGKHNLDTTDINSLAKDLAKRLNLNVIITSEYKYYQTLPDSEKAILSYTTEFSYPSCYQLSICYKSKPLNVYIYKTNISIDFYYSHRWGGFMEAFFMTVEEYVYGYDTYIEDRIGLKYLYNLFGCDKIYYHNDGEQEIFEDYYDKSFEELEGYIFSKYLPETQIVNLAKFFNAPNENISNYYELAVDDFSDLE